MAHPARRTLGFWLLAVTVVTLFAASSAPSPLYVVYQQRWDFSPIVLTLIFAAYAAGLLVSLLTVGGLSDLVGRRPVIAVALAVELVSMVAFLEADGVTALFVARVVQGLATGAATGALSAAISDLAPTDRPSLASAVNTASPALGLAVGALASGALVEYAPSPRTLVYAILAVLFVLLAVSLPFVPEAVQRRPGALRSLRPRAAVPLGARAAFKVAAPVLVATWAVGGLMLSLGPSLAANVLGLQNHLIGGLVVTTTTAVSSITSVLVRDRHPRNTVVQASLVLAAGVGVVLVALGTTSTPVFFAGLAIAGAGFGASFVAALNLVAPFAPADVRAELFAALFVVSYGAFGGSAVVAGLAVPSFGLRPTAIGVGAGVILLALLAAVAGRRTPAAAAGSTAQTGRTPASPGATSPAASSCPASAPTLVAASE